MHPYLTAALADQQRRDRDHAAAAAARRHAGRLPRIRVSWSQAYLADPVPAGKRGSRSWVLVISATRPA